MSANVLGPASEKQRMFLTSTADLLIYGGGELCASTLKTAL